jgi:predicted metal-dependent peptidase
MSQPTFDLNLHIARLLLDEPFFAALSRRMDKRAVTSIPTAGVRLNKDTCRFELVYNPVWFETCIARRQEMGIEGAGVYDWCKGTLVHEFMHIVLGHVTGRLPEAGMSRQWNIAGDLAINSDLMREGGDHMLPPECCFPTEGIFVEMAKGLSAEAYYALLDQMQDEQDEDEQDDSGEGEGDESEQDGQGGAGDEQGDGEGSGEGSDGSEDGSEGQGKGQGAGEPHGDHSGWGEGGDDNTAREIAEERLREFIKEAAEEADKAGNWGSCSGRTKREIRESLRSTVDWRAVLRYFVRTTVKANKRSTVRRINKRYPFIHSGKKVTRYARIAISVDQSGSVSDAMLASFYGELNKLATIVEFTVVPFDDTVFEDGIHVWKKNQRNPSKRYCCGGTNFDAPTQWVNENKFDGHIVLTDMYAPKPVRSTCPRMWMTDRDGASMPYFKTNERVIVVEDKK